MGRLLKLSGICLVMSLVILVAMHAFAVLAAYLYGGDPRLFRDYLLDHYTRGLIIGSLSMAMSMVVV